MKQMQSLGFGDTVDERIFFAGPPSSRDPMKREQVTARRIAGGLLRSTGGVDAQGVARCERIATWARRLGRELGLDADALLDIELGALLHDVGHGMPDAPADSGVERVFRVGLDADTSEIVSFYRHPERSAQILQGIPELRRAAPVVRAHHERFDGAGFPYGLRGDEVPIEARIFHVAEAYDAATSGRAPRRRMTDAEAREEILRGSGTRFDPIVVAAFDQISASEWCALVAVPTAAR
jgi:HD-GYP domain-containing protein (c-di-GMP phosphodiesterase class II)